MPSSDPAAHLMNTYGRLPMTVSHGQGVHMWDTQGKRYLDALSGIAVLNGLVMITYFNQLRARGLGIRDRAGGRRGLVDALGRCGGRVKVVEHGLTGAGTDIAKGKEEREFDGEKYIMERGIVADLSIVHAWKGDTEGNLVYRKTARNFNPMMATASKNTVAEVENLVEPGQIDPDHIVTPGVYVKRIIHVPNAVKHIEQRTVRKRVMT